MSDSDSDVSESTDGRRHPPIASSTGSECHENPMSQASPANSSDRDDEQHLSQPEADQAEAGSHSDDVLKSSIVSSSSLLSRRSTSPDNSDQQSVKSNDSPAMPSRSMSPLDNSHDLVLADPSGTRTRSPSSVNSTRSSSPVSPSVQRSSTRSQSSSPASPLSRPHSRISRSPSPSSSVDISRRRQSRSPSPSSSVDGGRHRQSRSVSPADSIGSGSPLAAKRRRRLVRRSSASSSSSSRNSSSGDERAPERSPVHKTGSANASDDEQEPAQVAHRRPTMDRNDVVDQDDDNVPEERVANSDNMLDFDVMMDRKRAERRGRRRRGANIDLINDNDDCIAKMLADMRLAADEDRELNSKKLPATKKLSMLAVVMTQLNKVDLQMAFIEANLLSVLTEWLSPMPDKSLPSKEIRTAVLKFLKSLQIDDQSRLKESGIGKAVMYLYKHPRETRENRQIANQIISAWARPIFNLKTDFKSMSENDRLLLKQGQLDRSIVGPKRKTRDEVVDDQTGLRPGDPGWSYRARVPKLEISTYTNRPEWQTNVDMARSSDRSANGGAKTEQMARFERHMRAVQERRRNTQAKHAVPISIEGRKMAL